MDTRDKEIIIERYSKRFRKHGDDIQSLASGNEQRRAIRFQVLSGVGDLNNSSVLDLGCGLGDFYGYLLKQFTKPSFIL